MVDARRTHQSGKYAISFSVSHPSQTFDAMLDREGEDALREALDDEELCVRMMHSAVDCCRHACFVKHVLQVSSILSDGVHTLGRSYDSLCVEAHERQLRVKALRTPGRVLDRRPSAEAKGSNGSPSFHVKGTNSSTAINVAASSVSQPAPSAPPITEDADIPAAPALYSIIAARLSPPASPASSRSPSIPPRSPVKATPLDTQLAEKLEEAHCQLSARFDNADFGSLQGSGDSGGTSANSIAAAACQRALLEPILPLKPKAGAGEASAGPPVVYPYSRWVSESLP